MILIDFSKLKPFLYIFLYLLQYRVLLLMHFSIKQCSFCIPKLMSSSYPPGLFRFLHRISPNQKQSKNLICLYLFYNQLQKLSDSELVRIPLFPPKDCFLPLYDNDLVLYQYNNLRKRIISLTLGIFRKIQVSCPNLFFSMGLALTVDGCLQKPTIVSDLMLANGLLWVSNTWS